MPIDVTCPDCSSTLRAPDDAVGRQVRCPRCETVLTVRDPGGNGPGTGMTDERLPARARPAYREEEREEERGPRERRDRDREDDRGPSRSRDRDGLPPRGPTPGGSQVAMGLGIASLVCGIVAVPFALFPCTTVFGLVLAGVGLVLGVTGGILAMMKQGQGVAFPIAGSAVSLLAASFFALWAFVCAGFISSSKQSFQQAQQAAEQNQLLADDRQKANLVAQGYLEAGRDVYKDGRVEVRIVSITLGPITLDRPGAAPAVFDTNYVRVKVSVRNVSGKDLDYKSWGLATQLGGVNTPRLNDGMRGTVAPFRLGPNVQAVGQQKDTVLRPGQEITDLIVFEKGWLRKSNWQMDLPGMAVGAAQPVRFLVPKAMVPWE